MQEPTPQEQLRDGVTITKINPMKSRVDDEPSGVEEVKIHASVLLVCC